MDQIKALVGLIADLALDVSGAGKVGKIISTISRLLKAGVDGYQDIKPDIDRIITALRGNGEITAEQLAELDKIEQDSEAAFEKAASAAGFPAKTD
jgi:hypothetical protein